ncbi:sulfotransferase [Phenylobacterium sp.]|jgi:hypothetical protein|uniref:sulfotransferase family protein n=1 Tax=Phenylobacterium sp. TaxID=1871053 RepID=UPI002E2F66E2|nr:sulfotransferase [Phenylobacterium sp.]HEX4709368.1 sulfotransferase [Phenylobacterium sp.]
MAHLEPALLSFADGAAQRFGLGARLLDAEEFIDRAERRAGRRFGARDFEPALRMLLESCEAEAELSVFGRLSLQWDISRLLRNLLRLEEAEEENPEIVRARVDAPIFITGLPRSGTTFLQMLLVQDEGNRTPLTWQTMQPYPDRRGGGRDWRVQRARLELGAFRRITPDLAGLHPVGATAPQECTEITAHVLQSLRFDTIYRIPSYLSWLERLGHRAAFRFHKRFLQHLQAQYGRRRWVLKCPDHVFALRAILANYPDARFVFVHRDPVAVLSSVAKLTETLRAPFTRRLDKLAIGAEVAQRWFEGAERILAAEAWLPQSRLLNLHHRELTTEPLRTLERVYRHFDLPLGAAARGRASSFLQRQPRAGYGNHRYDPAEFGLDPARIRQRFEPYLRTVSELG